MRKSNPTPGTNQNQGFVNKKKSFASSIKNKAIHVKKVSTPGVKALGRSNPDTIRPGSSTSGKFAPKSNRTRLSYKKNTSTII